MGLANLWHDCFETLPLYKPKQDEAVVKKLQDMADKRPIAGFWKMYYRMEERAMSGIQATTQIILSTEDEYPIQGKVTLASEDFASVGEIV